MESKDILNERIAGVDKEIILLVNEKSDLLARISNLTYRVDKITAQISLLETEVTTIGNDIKKL